MGFTQRFSPACYAQSLAQGLYYLIKVPGIHRADFQPEAFKRSLNFRLYGDKFIDRSAENFFNLTGLGFNAATSVRSGRARKGRRVGSTYRAVALVKNLLQTKKNTYPT